MINTLILFVSGIIIAAGLDYVWIGHAFGSFYKTEIGALGRTVAGQFSPDLLAGIGVYVLMSIGVIAFVLPKVGDGGYAKALALGALWGLILGGVYELTNYSMLAGWSGKLVLLDMFWTMLSGALTSMLLLALSRAL